MDSTGIAALIDRDKRLPMYIQLAQSIEDLIASGGLVAGDHVPTEAELCKALKVSAVTVKKGMGLLVRKDLVRRIPGRGTFVSSAVQRSSPAISKSQSLSASKRFGILMPEDSGAEYGVRDSWHSRIADGFELTISRSNCSAVYLPMPGVEGMADASRWDHLTAVAAFEKVPDTAIYEPLWSALRKQGIPSVCVSYCICPMDHDSICFEQSKAGHIAVAHLAAMGYHRFILADSTEPDRWSRERSAGFVAGLEVQGLPKSSMSAASLPFGGSWQELGTRLGKKIEQINSRTAIVATNDELAIGIADGLRNRGAVFGRDYGLIGCGDEPSSRRFGLTTIGFPLAKAGDLAARRLLGLLEQEPGTFRYSLWPYVLRRNSTLLASEA